MNVYGATGERVFSRTITAAALVSAAHLAEGFEAPHFRYAFNCERPRDVRAALELQNAIRGQELRATAAWANLVRFDAARLLELKREHRELRRDVVWRDGFLNTVVTVGKNHILDTEFAGSAYTASWALGLVDGGSAPTIVAGDTMASHAGWTENVGYSNSNRLALSFNAASGGSKALSSAAAFNINATSTIAGGFFCTNNTKSGTTGTLYSAGTFTGGNRSVSSGDTLNVSATQSV